MTGAVNANMVARGEELGVVWDGERAGHKGGESDVPMVIERCISQRDRMR